MSSVVPVILEVRKSRPRGNKEFMHSGSQSCKGLSEGLLPGPCSPCQTLPPLWKIHYFHLSKTPIAFKKKDSLKENEITQFLCKLKTTKKLSPINLEKDKHF